MNKLEGFEYKDCVVGGDLCWLIAPKKNFGVVWTEENKKYRSAIVLQSNGRVISRGFNKFTNCFETPEFEPWDESWPVEARHKMDGSLLIVSIWRGELIMRTRGTTDARNLPNGHEIDVLKRKYSLFFDKLEREGKMNVSYLFEWTTPTNVIVVREHEEPTLTLLAIVNNEDGTYWEERHVDDKADAFGFPRPKKYVYASIAECLADVTAWIGSEGVVTSSPDGQTLKKFKAEEYLRLHRLKSAVASVRALLAVYVDFGAKPDFDSFYRHVELTTDHEIAENHRKNMENIIMAHKTVEMEKAEARLWVDKFTEMNRKELAFEITRRFKDWRKGYLFTYLDGKDLDHKALAKIIETKVKE